MQSGGPSQSHQENATWKKLGNMHLPVPTMHEPRSLSISTRGIGLMLADLKSTIKNLRFPDSSDDDSDDYEVHYPIAEIYRASLAQLEAKMYFAKENQSGPFSVRSATDSSLFSPPKTFDRSFLWKNQNISPIALIINSIGHVEVNGKHFEPRFLSKSSPLNIRITNLRKYCVDMSNLETDPSDRIAGHKLNSIPSAKWEFQNAEDPQSVYLANPDEIIPADYNDHSMRRDLDKLREFVFIIECRQKHLRGEIKYKHWGDPGILASTQVATGKIIRLENGEKKNGCGTIDFWSPEPLEPSSWTIGAITLAGEILDPTIPSQRSQCLAIQDNSVDCWSAVYSLIRSI